MYVSGIKDGMAYMEENDRGGSATIRRELLVPKENEIVESTEPASAASWIGVQTLYAEVVYHENEKVQDVVN